MVVKRPTGHKIIDQNISASIIEDYVGDAIVQFPYHGLGTGDTVYIESDIDEYNGFWYVTAVDTDQFKISEHSEADFVEYYQDADIDYYQTQEHDWSSIFLPIVYKITNDLWPTNSTDTAQTVSSFSDDNGFTNLVLSGVLKSAFNALEFVKISGGDFDGVYQIVEVINTSEISISLPYDASLSFSGVTVQYYYNNYQTRVKIYAGLPSYHPWSLKKPYEEVAELSLTPDENNEVMFSVSDYITQKVAIKNNTLLFSLPLNLDAFTGFYISTSESYDYSDNYSLYTSEAEFLTDSFEGYAIAGKLPFKNMYSGDYADYVYASGSPALWLTLFDRFFAVHGLYFDVSFIKNIIGDFYVAVVKTASDYSITENLLFTDQGIGVYRIPLTIDSAYDSYCIQAFKGATSGFEPAVMDAIDTWTNLDTGGPPWILDGAIPEADTNLLGLNVTSDKWHTDYAFEALQTYGFDYTFRSPGTTFHIDIVDGSGTLLTSLSVFMSADTLSGNYTFVAPMGAAGINIWFFQPYSCGSPSGNCEGRILAFDNVTEGSGSEPAFAVTEEICIDIIDSCESADQFVADNIRELEDGNYRLLE